MIRLRGIRKRLPSGEGMIEILRGIDLDVERGESVAIVGPSGSGKSTLLGLIAGLDAPSEGTVTLGGTDLSTLTEDQLARLRGERIGFVFQAFHLIPTLTALENVMVPLELAGRRDAEAAARALLERVGLGGRGRHYPAQLSGGEQQRVALARAVARDPDLVLADEPTGSLDAPTGRRVIELLFELSRERGTTLVLVTHDPEVASRSDRTVELRDGLIDGAATRPAGPDRGPHGAELRGVIRPPGQALPQAPPAPGQAPPRAAGGERVAGERPRAGASGVSAPPTAWRFVLATALRELRGSRGRLAFVVLCIAAGVAALVAVESFTDLADRSVRSEARRLLAADLEVSARRPLTAEEQAAVRRVAAPAAATEVVELVTMASAPPAARPRDAAHREAAFPDAGHREAGSPGAGAARAGAVVPGAARRATPAAPPRTRLVELRAIGAGYPFYGRLVTDPPEAVGRLAEEPVAVVHPELLGQLGLRPGDRLTLGRARFAIAGVIRDEPDRAVALFSAGPRVVIGLDQLPRTDLVQPGSRVAYRTLLRLAGGPPAPAVARALAEAIPDPAVRITTFQEAQPRLRRFLERLADYLRLLSLVGVVLAGVGVGSQIAVHVGRQLDAVAMLRCLGATGREITAVFVAQAVLLGLVGGAAGALAGTLVQAVLPRLLAGLLPVEVPLGVSAGAVARGIGLGVAVAVLVAWLPLARLARVPALRVLRRGLEVPERRLDPRRLAAAGVLATAFAGAAVALAGSLQVGAVFAGGLAGTVLLLWGSAAAAVAWLRRQRGRFGFAGRHGLVSLRRPGNQTVAAVIALGSGVALLVALALLEGSFAGEVAAARGARVPSLFLIDIQPDQAAGVGRLLAEAGAETTGAPMVQARLRAINGEPVQSRPAARYEGDRRRDGTDWTRTREYRLTYTEALPEGNEVVAGRWWSGPGAGPAGAAGPSRVAARPGASGGGPEASLEVEFAERLGVGLGDRLTFDVQGVRLTATVTSLRRVRWETMTPNFFVILSPGWLEEAPQQRIAAVRLPPEVDRGALQGRIVAAFPNVTIIDLTRVVAKVAAVLDRVAFAVRFMALFCLAAGAVVLAGAVAGTAQERAREASLLKVLGADRRRIACVLLVEFAALGGLAGAAGALAAAGLAWAILRLVLDLPWPWHLGPWPFAAGLAAALVLTAAGGVASAWGVLGRRPLELLRDA